jgi:hypothetical protein
LHREAKAVSARVPGGPKCFDGARCRYEWVARVCPRHLVFIIVTVATGGQGPFQQGLSGTASVLILNARTPNSTEHVLRERERERDITSVQPLEADEMRY